MLSTKVEAVIRFRGIQGVSVHSHNLYISCGVPCEIPAISRISFLDAPLFLEGRRKGFEMYDGQISDGEKICCSN